LTAFVVEVVVARIEPSQKRPPGVSIRLVQLVMVVGWVAAAAQALSGQGTYQAQVAAASPSKLAPLFTPFQDWPLFAVFLVLWLFRQGGASRKTTYSVLAVSVVLEFGLTLYEARLAPLMAMLLAIVFGALMVRLIRLRWVVVVVIAGALLWPPLYNLRNNVRIVEGGNVTEIGLHQASSRLRLDLEFSQVASVPHIPIAIDHDSPLTLIRYGLLPRLVDPSRPPLRTASELSVALGSTSTNSDSLTSVGDIYVENGWLGVLMVYAVIAALAAWFIRRRSPWSMCMLGLLISQAVWIESTWPIVVPSVLQGLVSLGVIWLVYRCWPALRMEKAARPLLPAPSSGQ
jgi:hypothetical protein